MQPSELAIGNEIKRLVHLIKHQNENYFQKGISEISDYEYDQLLKRLSLLEEAYPHLKQSHSPTEALGERPIPGFSLVYHQAPMLSLAKTYLEEEIAQFVTRVNKILPGSSIDFLCEPKIDGMALSIVYEQGKLVRVVTRGDGEKGDDITRNAIKCLPFPKTIEDFSYQSFEVRGEACMPKAVFEALNNVRKEQGEALWANPRNITAGTLKTLDIDLVKGRSLAFYGYSFYSQAHPCATQQEGLALLSKLGFATAPFYKLCSNTTEIMAYIHYWGQHKDELPFGIDGIVIKVNDLTQQTAIGMTSTSPRWAIAYKYQPDMAHSILEKVTFQVGRTGVVTPIAHFQPMALAGTMVRRASLYNADALAKKDLYVGDTIFIEKGGGIIPKVVGVDVTRRVKTSMPIAFAQICPACHTVLQREEGTVAYYCPNKQQCLPQLKGALLHFAHRKAMDIDSLGPKTVEALCKAKLVTTAVDLYTLRYEEMRSLEGFQQVMIQKLLSNIKSSKSKSFDKVVFALGIQYVGETVAKKLALYFKSMARLQRVTITELLQLPDVGEKIAQSIMDYLQDPFQQAILVGLQKAGLQFAMQEELVLHSKLPLASKKFVITGIFQQFTRQELIKYIEQAGGTLLSSISDKVDYLVVGSKAGSSKLAKAKTLAIPILGENDIARLVL
ncbi:NAD-dependent DNA ligase LigA [Candidatus Cardinium hertigii]|jgi:DNA ligase (NAD+)|uniref:DNA ligase n=1 Tax=Candidatus Cardinium hertigii TaxID=247481 RepID=A0A3N2QAT8_9BACT|nr:NAD-dependent DNA ligase LigA [Candidatus Cardinium hertigii]ROT46903.1 NAD-dependent DNA ligase LigA [Candidatus Cardinium hertigii]